ncbi:MAG TPA: hypothetical protein VI566_10180 [Xanthomonadales bacterium]|nr:hypothetical protein [Xanthomonadales bacterium]
MSDKTMFIKPVAAAVGVAFVTSLAFSTAALAADNPFAAVDLDSGYLLAGDGGPEEGKCGEGKCGEGKCGGEGHTAEGHCGGDKAAEGKCGENKAAEGQCGEKKAEEAPAEGDNG